MADSFISRLGLTRAQWAGFGPIDHRLALTEKPSAILFDERVEIADRGDHEAAHRPLDLDVMRQAVSDPRSVITVEHRGALTVEMHGGDVGVELVEHRGQGGPPPKGLGRRRAMAVHN